MQAVRENGLVGELYVPEGRGPFPAVLCIGGSSGGIKNAEAPLLAKAGFVAFSLGYFGAPDLPPVFADLPLEHFAQGVGWLLAQSVVQGPTIGITGRSRGSEAALQLATLTPQVGAVVAYVPSGIRWMGVDDRPSWTYGGDPLPYAKWPNKFDDTGAAISKTDRFNQVFADTAAIADAEIAVEQAHCPMLLISGTDDQLWPAERMANMIIERLKRNDYPYPYRHITYANAGHRIKVPGLDRSSYEPVSEDTVTHELLQLGGTYQGNKTASEQSWPEVLEFFRSCLRDAKTPG